MLANDGKLFPITYIRVSNKENKSDWICKKKVNSGIGSSLPSKVLYTHSNSRIEQTKFEVYSSHS